MVTAGQFDSASHATPFMRSFLLMLSTMIQVQGSIENDPLFLRLNGLKR